MAVRGRRYAYLPTGIRTAAVPYESICQTLQINLPYLTYAFPIILPEWTTQYAWRYPRYNQSRRTIPTRAVSVEWRYDRYESITYHMNYITYPPVSSVQNVLLGSLSNTKKSPIGYYSRRISHSSPHSLISMAFKLTRKKRNDCSRHGASSMCSSSWNWRRGENEKRRSEKTIASKKRRKKVKDWLKRIVQLGHNRTLLHEL